MILARALSALRPGVEFTFNDDDLSTVRWNVEGTTTPTQVEVDEKIAELEAIDATKVTAKESAGAKLAALGLTDAEVRAVVGI
jgi:hypothetical protein